LLSINKMYYSALAWLTRSVEVLGPLLLRRSVVVATALGVVVWVLLPLSGPINVIPVIAVLGLLYLWIAGRYLRKKRGG
jgi:hypothetical protein